MNYLRRLKDTVPRAPSLKSMQAGFYNVRFPSMYLYGFYKTIIIILGI